MERRNDIDFYKGIAIIAVVLYHVGILPYGFLGVEIFLAISGYLLIPKLINNISSGGFKYFTWLFKHLYRIWPITLAASAVCLIIGYFVMIPDSYENMSESVVASNLFSNNILSAITTKNYWDSANEYKPLMQMWYLGIIAQFYLVFPVLLYAFYRFTRKIAGQNWGIAAVSTFGILSLALYLFPGTPFTQKFYFLQYRIWEFALGGIAGLIVAKSNIRLPKFISICTAIAIVVVLCLGFTPLSKIDNVTIIGAPIAANTNALKISGTILIAFATTLLLLTNIKLGGVLCKLGIMSLSIFVWHQVILAFIRYSCIESFTAITLIIYLIITLIIGYLSYRFIESIRLNSLKSKIIFYILFVAVTSVAFAIYRHAGVVRDIPELGVSVDNPLANRNTEYTDQFYKLDKDFETDKLHVLVVGNSFARDFVGILSEYNTADSLEISYKFDVNNLDAKRIKDADYIFFFGSKKDFPTDKLNLICDNQKIYGISTKYFGRNFGLFYSKRNQPGYFSQTTPSNDLCDSINAQWQESWGKNHFINLMDIIKTPDGSIPIFTDSNKVISFDCRHLTQDGCKYYAGKIRFDKIFNKSNPN